MRPAQKEHVAEKRRNNRPGPYTQSGRKAKLAASGGWTPSIWNALTFWKSSNASRNEQEEEKDEDHEEAQQSDFDGSPDSLNRNITMRNVEDNEDYDTSLVESNMSSVSDASEAQVLSQLTMQSARHVRFQLPNGDRRRSQFDLPLPSSLDTPLKSSSPKAYSAPLPPSSPFRHSDSPPKDPLSQVSQYIDTVIRPRGGECTDVEALGLSMLIQSSVNQSGSRHATPLGTSPHRNPFLAPPSNSASPSISSSPIRPTFTTPSTDIAAILASSPSPSSPSRTLKQNPNGSIYYQGGGSARPRHRSTTFASSSGRKRVVFSNSFGEGRGDGVRMNGTVEPTTPSDGKRRRVGEERDSSTALPSGSRLAPPAPPNGTTASSQESVPTNGLHFGTSSPASRFTTSTPARPSPLRQSMRAESTSPGSSSPGSASEGSPRSRFSVTGVEGRSKASEKASEIMAGIINDATPKKPSTRSPTKRNRKTTTKASKPPPRPARAAAPPPDPEPRKLSALETIQKTAPPVQTGSKRSHTSMTPPALPSLSTNGIAKGVGAGPIAEKPFVIEIDDDEPESEPRSPKKQRSEKQEPSNGKKAAEKERRAVEICDVDMATASPADADNKRPVFPGLFKAPARFQSAPKEPSPLRQSFQPDGPSSPPQNAAPASEAFMFAAKSNPAASTFKPATASFTQTSISSTLGQPEKSSSVKQQPSQSLPQVSAKPSFNVTEPIPPVLGSVTSPAFSFNSSSSQPAAPSAEADSSASAAASSSTSSASSSSKPPPGNAATDSLVLAKKQVLELPSTQTNVKQRLLFPSTSCPNLILQPSQTPSIRLHLP
ncbi:hypothetical protein K439DRAFT_741169 [Ramaria rubella]|nr:hypothetical protein K439DRAFT_741169 [Ramaria rubella]